jgi:TfoX/Sxy family transcriptional regulator of competence genes
MAAWRKSPPELIAFFDDVLPDDPRVERRKMFGYPCAFAGGNMFTGLHQESMIVRLGEADREKLLRENGAARFEPMSGRPMREYVALPPTMAAKDARAWVARSLDYAASLPAKKAKTGAAARKPSVKKRA